MRRGSIGGFYKGGVDKLVLRKSSVTMAATGGIGILSAVVLGRENFG